MHFHLNFIVSLSDIFLSCKKRSSNSSSLFFSLLRKFLVWISSYYSNLLKGGFGKVYMAKRNLDQKIYAIKVIEKNVMVRKHMSEQVVVERDALAIAKSPFVVKLFYSLQSKNQICQQIFKLLFKLNLIF
jgi:hypothetical protein